MNVRPFVSVPFRFIKLDRACLKKTVLMAILALFIAAPVSVAQDDPAAPGDEVLWGVIEEPEPIRVFIDPGHGGGDLGARSSRMILEKNVAFKIATLMKERLSQNERLEVVLSRLDDVEISAIERVNMANSMKASLYLGVHADGGLTPQAHPMKVFITPGDGAEDSGEKIKGDAWEAINSRFSGANQALAQAVAKQLESMDPARGVDVVRTGRLFLGGLNMAAVTVEPVDLANPEDEVVLSDDDKRLSDIAAALSRAVIEYLEEAGEL